MQLGRLLLLFAIPILCASHLTAQQYPFVHYTPKDGLVNNRARFMFQDSRGRLYFATYGGLSVYDGSRFTNYTTDNGLKTSLVNQVIEMGEDSFWVIPNGGMLHSLVHGQIRNIETTDHFYPVINQLIKCSDGIYYAISDNGLFRFLNDRFERIPLKDNTGTDFGRFLIQGVETGKKLLLITDPNLAVFPGPGKLFVFDLVTQKLIANDPNHGIGFITTSPSKEIWVATKESLKKIDLAALENAEIKLLPISSPYKLPVNISSNCIFFDSNRNLWLSTGTGVIKANLHGQNWLYSEANGLPASTVSSIFEDKEKNMWFTNDQTGVSKLVNQQIEFYSQLAPNFTANFIYADGKSDSAWFYDTERNRLLLISLAGEKLFEPVNSPASFPAALLMGKRPMLISQYRIYDIHFLAGNKFSLERIPSDSLTSTGACIEDDRSNVYLFSQAKLTSILQDRTVQQPFNHFTDQLVFDGQGRIWCATRDNKIFIIKPGDAGDSNYLQVLKVYDSSRLPLMGPRSIAVDKQGNVWIGTRDHGLFCFFFKDTALLSWKQITTKEGMSENFINFLLCDKENTIWASTPAGLNKIHYTGKNFTVENVTGSNNLYEYTVRVQATSSGIHYVQTRSGIIKILPQPTSKNNNYTPSLLFSTVIAGNEIVNEKEAHTFPYQRNNIAFFLAAPSFLDEKQTRFSYRLEGSSNANWSAPSRQAEINLVNLPPGKYSLQVKAQFLNGFYPEQTASYSFRILSPWWQTWWFRTLVVLCLLAISILVARSYVRRRLAKQRIELEKQQAVEKERTRIATDMHDDLGSGLSRIRFLSETIAIKKQQQQPVEEDITRIREYANEMIDKMGEIVWALNEKNDSLSDLLSYTRSYAAEYLFSNGIYCKVDIPDALPTLFVSGEFRRNIYLAIKETLHNIVKHAQADSVMIAISVDQELVVSIQDNGKGFDRSTVRPFGNGLSNMQKRMNDIHGKLEITQKSGTTVVLSAPLDI